MSKVGNNDPCTCGSGKKYKKCCKLKPGGKDLKISLSAGKEASSLTSFFKSAVSSRPAPVAPKKEAIPQNIAEKKEESSSENLSDGGPEKPKT